MHSDCLAYFEVGMRIGVQMSADVAHIKRNEWEVTGAAQFAFAARSVEEEILKLLDYGDEPMLR